MHCRYTRELHYWLASLKLTAKSPLKFAPRALNKMVARKCVVWHIFSGTKTFLHLAKISLRIEESFTREELRVSLGFKVFKFRASTAIYRWKNMCLRIFFSHGSCDVWKYVRFTLRAWCVVICACMLLRSIPRSFIFRTSKSFGDRFFAFLIFQNLGSPCFGEISATKPKIGLNSFLRPLIDFHLFFLSWPQQILERSKKVRDSGNRWCTFFGEIWQECQIDSILTHEIKILTFYQIKEVVISTSSLKTCILGVQV